MIAFMCFISFNSIVKADYQATVITHNGEKCELYSKSTGKCIYKNTSLNSYVPKVVWMDTGEQVTVVTGNGTLPGNKNCSTKYVYINYAFPDKPNTIYGGWFCDNNLTTSMLNDNMRREFAAAGFPSSYFERLAILKTVHPNWTFKAINTGLDFNNAVSNEALLGRSLIQVSSSNNNEGYLSTASGAYNYDTDTYTVFDGSNWYNANEQTIAFYMDPRNLLIDMYIFQFEALAYEKKLQTKSVVNRLLSGDYLNNYADSFMTAASESGVSPVYLASLSKQEVGGRSTATTAVSGKSFTYNGKTYSSIYNAYNIGATSGSDAVYKGLYFAAGSGGYTTYNRPWNTLDKAIRGGAKWISTNYISVGQNTSYFKKWNVVYNYNTNISNRYSNYNHQYMTNIQAPISEAHSTYNSYYDSGIIDSSFVFYIPVYNNMPNETKLPNIGNQNNYLKSLTINNKSIASFSGSNTNYNYYVDYNVNSINIGGSPVKDTSSVSGLGTVNLNNKNTTRDIVVTAQNGATRTYRINIIKNDAPATTVQKKEETKTNTTTTPSIVSVLNSAGIKNGTNYITGLGLGYKANTLSKKITNVYASSNIKIKNSNGSINNGNIKTGDVISIVIGQETKNYTAVIYGDPSGDGTINAVDYVRIKNYIMGRAALNNSYKEAADVNKDGKVNAIDYVQLKNYIMGRTTINQ